MSLIEFYKRTLNTAGFVYDDEGFIKAPRANGKPIQVVDSGRPMVLPTPEHKNSLTEVIDGEATLVKTLFNPLNEDAVKGESISLRKLKNAMEHKLNFSLAMTVELLLELGLSLEMQKKASLNLNKFIGSLNKARTSNVKDLIDEGSIDRWLKIYKASIKAGPTKGLIHTYLKRGGMLNGTKYNRLATASFPIYKLLDTVNKNTPLLGVKMRGKDPKVLKLIFEYIFTGIDDNPEKYAIGSLDPVSPGFISLTKLYITIANRLNELLNDLKFMDEVVSTSAIIDVKITEDELDKLDIYKNELAAIPSDIDAGRHRSLVKDAPTEQPKQEKATARSILNSQNGIAESVANYTPTQAIVQQVLHNNNTVPAPIQQQQVPPVQQQQVQTVDTSGMTAAQKILYGNMQVPNTQQVQQQRPMGINTMTQQVQQQQMVMPNNMAMTNQYAVPQQLPMQNNMYQHQSPMQQRPMGINTMTGYNRGY